MDKTWQKMLTRGAVGLAVGAAFGGLAGVLYGPVNGAVLTLLGYWVLAAGLGGVLFGIGFRFALGAIYKAKVPAQEYIQGGLIVGGAFGLFFGLLAGALHSVVAKIDEVGYEKLIYWLLAGGLTGALFGARLWASDAETPPET